MDYKSIYYPESKFGGFTDVDGTIAFYIRVNSFILRLHLFFFPLFGCGKGDYAEDPIYLRRELRVFKGKCRKVIGIDVDRVARENPFLDEFRPIESGAFLRQCLSSEINYTTSRDLIEGKH